jgi:hypothetical protein
LYIEGKLDGARRGEGCCERYVQGSAGRSIVQFVEWCKEGLSGATNQGHRVVQDGAGRIA